MKARVDSTRIAANDVLEIVLSPVDSAFPEYSPGSHVDFFVPGIGPRQYSLTGDGTVYSFMIQKEADGRGGSQFIHASLRPGDHIEISSPRNTFPLQQDRPLLFIAGGIGITPFLSMIRGLDPADFRLLYFCRSDDRIVSDPNLAELLRLGVARVSIAMSPEQTLQTIDEEIRKYPDPFRVYCCGPNTLNASVRKICEDTPWIDFRSESFKPMDADVSGPASGFDVVLNTSGKRVHVAPQTSILEAIREAGIELPSSCESGLCGTCKVSYLSGRVDHRDLVLSEEERKTSILVCCSRSFSEELVLEI